jgi:hypothetical protein
MATYRLNEHLNRDWPDCPDPGGQALQRHSVKLRRFLLAFIICLTFLNLACHAANSITSTKIRDILDHPRNYENKEVTIYGTVTKTVSLLVVKYFEIQDGTGAISVVTDKLLPAKGEKLKVTGRMAVIEVGTERWVVLRENNERNSQKAASKNPEARQI